MTHYRHRDQCNDNKEPKRDGRLMLDVYTNNVTSSHACNSMVIVQTDTELVCSDNDNIFYGIGMSDDDEYGQISISPDGQYFHIKSDGIYRIDFTATLIPVTDVEMHLKHNVVNCNGKSITEEDGRLLPLLRTKLPNRYGSSAVQVNTFTVVPLKAGYKLSTRIDSQRERVIIPKGARLLITQLF